MVRETRIVTELGMPVQARVRCTAHHEAGKVAVLVCLRGTLICVPPFSLTGCNERGLTTPSVRLWDAAKWVTRRA